MGAGTHGWLVCEMEAKPLNLELGCAMILPVVSVRKEGGPMSDIGFLIFFGILILFVVIVAVVVVVSAVSGAAAAIANNLKEDDES